MHKRFLILGLGLLIGCDAYNPALQEQCWKMESTQHCYSGYNSSKLHLPSSNTYQGIELDLVKCKGKVVMHVNTLFHVIEPLNQEQRLAEVEIEIDGVEEVYQGKLLSGNQRVLLSKQATDRIIQGLLSGHPVTVATGIHQTEIPVKGFKEAYQKFLNNS